MSILEKIFNKPERPVVVELKDIPPDLLKVIKEQNEIEFYNDFQVRKLVPPPFVQQDSFEKWLPWIGIGVNLIILIKVLFIK